MKNLSKILIAASLTTFVACNDDFENPVDEIQVTSGDANFSKYVALGNSLTSGFTDNALFISGQQNSYPNMLATQMMMAGGGSFAQPLMPDEIGGFSNLGVAGRLNLVINPETGTMGPVASPAQSPFTAATGGPFGNMGVPGAKSYHLLTPNYGNPAGLQTDPMTANPYFVRFASSPGTTIVADAAAQQPTFFSLWIGNNDVLSYATGGGVGTDQTGNTDLTTYGSQDITDPTKFAEVMTGIVHTMASTVGAKGVIANIPSITDIPYFTTVPNKPFSPAALGSDNISSLNTLFSLVNAAFEFNGAGDRKIYFDPQGASGAVIIDEEVTDLTNQIRDFIIANNLADPLTATLLGQTYGKARQTNTNDLLVFTSQTILGKLNTARLEQLMNLGVPQAQAAQLSIDGVTSPLEDKWVLTNDEKQNVLTATAAYNAAIRQLATDYNLAFVDAHAAMKDLSSQSGITYFGNTYTTTYVSGGAFSLDAVHLTGKGYAVVANYFIDAINQKYGSTLRDVNPNNYPGVMIP